MLSILPNAVKKTSYWISVLQEYIYGQLNNRSGVVRSCLSKITQKCIPWDTKQDRKVGLSWYFAKKRVHRKSTCAVEKEFRCDHFSLTYLSKMTQWNIPMILSHGDLYPILHTLYNLYTYNCNHITFSAKSPHNKLISDTFVDMGIFPSGMPQRVS